jgi:murein DD-endopeptidase MepM/ murein hydrolase activator NlpD
VADISYDPEVVQWIEKAAKAKGADPNVLLATALQESGARRGAVGDQGTSFGPFQHHKGGALGPHDAAWANSYPATLERAGEFSRNQVHHGKGAAAVQRPADRVGYEHGVDSHMEQARRIISRDLQLAAHDQAKKTPTPPKVTKPGEVIEGQDLLDKLAGRGPVSGPQSALNELARIGHFKPVTLAPTRTAGSDSSSAPAPSPGNGRLPAAARPAKPTKPSSTRFRGKIIGTPHSGTHTVGNWESDNAVDIAMSKGTPIRAPFGGIIGSRIGSLNSSNPRFAGLRVHLQGAGDELYFAHLSRLTVKAGQRVKPGDIIGYSGVANGVAHLHLGSRSGDPGKYA